MSECIRVLIADDQAITRTGLLHLLAEDTEIEVVGAARTGAETVALAETLQPDVILMDLRMPVLGGVEATRRILHHRPEARVVVLTTFDEDTEIIEALRAGALGYLLKACSAEKLYEAVRASARNTFVLEPSVAAKLMAELDRRSQPAAPKVAPKLADPLSEREQDVLRLLASGCSNKEIGSRLNIAEGTVKNHMTNVLGKLQVFDRTQAALRARELGLI